MYNPHADVSQFYGPGAIPDPGATAPITEWLTDQTRIHMSDVLMPDGHTVRALDPETTIMYLNKGGICLPRRTR